VSPSTHPPQQNELLGILTTLHLVQNRSDMSKEVDFPPFSRVVRFVPGILEIVGSKLVSEAGHPSNWGLSQLCLFVSPPPHTLKEASTAVQHRLLVGQ
jgi:hypothetical protein